MNYLGAFVPPTALPNRLSAAVSKCTQSPSQVAFHPASSRSVTTPTMQQKTKESGKKRAAPTFATDIKGNIVWTLRSATVDNVDAVVELLDEKLPRDLVESMLEDSECCIVCETSVKGRKEGDGFSSVIMGVVLVDVAIGVRDAEKGFESGLVKHAHLITIAVSPDFPEEDGLKKLLLACLKKMKASGVVNVTHSTDNAKRTELLKECLFKSSGQDEFGTPSFTCDLVIENPDPMKKIN